MVKYVANISQRDAEGTLVTNLVYNQLNAPINVLMAVVKEKWVLSVVLDLAYALRLPLRVVIVLRLEVFLVLVLIVRDIPAARGLHDCRSLKHRTGGHPGRGNRLQGQQRGSTGHHPSSGSDS
jgi:hypothetical protein